MKVYNDNIRYLASGEMSTEEWVYYCAETAGAFIGGFLFGKYTSYHLKSNDNTNDLLDGKDTDSVKTTNEKYGIPDDISDKIRENTSLENYGKVTDVVEKWKSSHPDEKLTDSQLGEICRGVQDGKGTEDILSGVNEGGTSAKGLIGHDFEDYLSKIIGGEGLFSVGGRDFDGGIGSRWWEAKSGNFWSMLQENPNKLVKFKSDMSDRLRIATENGATYEIFSNTPIPESIKQWLIQKGITFTELLD